MKATGLQKGNARSEGRIWRIISISAKTEPLFRSNFTGKLARFTRGTVSRNCRNTEPKRTHIRNKHCSPWLHTMRRNSARECHNCSVVFRRSRISTGYSQPITAELSAGCKGSIHANSTLIPLQTHGNR